MGVKFGGPPPPPPQTKSPRGGPMGKGARPPQTPPPGPPNGHAPKKPRGRPSNPKSLKLLANNNPEPRAPRRHKDRWSTGERGSLTRLGFRRWSGLLSEREPASWRAGPVWRKLPAALPPKIPLPPWHRQGRVRHGLGRTGLGGEELGKKAWLGGCRGLGCLGRHGDPRRRDGSRRLGFRRRLRLAAILGSGAGAGFAASFASGAGAAFAAALATGFRTGFGLGFDFKNPKILLTALGRGAG